MPRLKNKYILEDVTQEFLSKSTPGKGRIIFEEGFNHKRNYKEEETAKWLLETFGGEITVLKESPYYKIHNPDYCWNQKLWELKDVKSVNSIDNGVRKAIKQISINTGGIIIDIKDLCHGYNAYKRAILNRINLYINLKIHIIIKKNNRLIQVIEIKKRR